MLTKATATMVLEKRYQVQDGKYPVRLRVIYNRQSKYYRIKGYTFSEEDWKKVYTKRPAKCFKNISEKLDLIEKKARAVIDGIVRFSFHEFENKFFEKEINKSDVFQWFDWYINKLTDEGRIGTSGSYKSAKRALRDFWTRPKLEFIDIDVKFLKKWEVFLLNLDGNSIPSRYSYKLHPSSMRKKRKDHLDIVPKSPTTVGIYMRNLRVIFNCAILEKTVSRDIYPFGRYGYTIKKSSKNKRALHFTDLKKIFDFTFSSRSDQYYKDLWLFSYMLNGSNIKDIANLRYRNIREKNIHFIRSKTKNTTSDLTELEVAIEPPMDRIINDWGVPSKEKENFIFPILNHSMTPYQKHTTISQVVKMINKTMRKLKDALGITKDITTYVARHSFATQLQRKGIPIENISADLSHSSLEVTMHYLESLNEEARARSAKAKMDFS